MKVLVAGDFCPRYRVEDVITKGEYSNLLSEVRYLTSNVDYSILNFECPIVNETVSPIKKQGPNLKCSIKGAEAAKWAGFNCFTLANNHLCDYGYIGVQNTIDSCRKLGIDFVGCGKTIKEANTTLYIDIHGQKLAIINCCEHEFSIATEHSAGCNPLNPIQQYYAIHEAKQKADIVLVIVHGGHEHFQLPSPRMIETYRFFVDAGADAVVNHHQHCFSGYEVYKNKPIFYGLGNFLFDHQVKRSGMWTEGLIVEFDFLTESTFFKIHPIRQCGNNPKVEVLPNGTYDLMLNHLNEQLSNAQKLSKAIDSFYSEGISQYTDIFEPCDNRYYYGALRRGWIKSQISTARFLSASNYISCESHRDKLLWWLDKEYYKMK